VNSTLAPKRCNSMAADVHEHLVGAPREDADRLAEWQLRGKGTRPQPSVPDLERQRDHLQAEIAGLDRARARVLEDKARFVATHGRLPVKDGEKATEQAARRYHALVDELEKARGDLYEARGATLWASLYPREPQLLDVPRRGLAGDLRQPLSKAGFMGQVKPEQVIEVLHEDARWLEHAASPEQRQALGEQSEIGAVWEDTPEGQAHRQREAAENAKRIERARWRGVDRAVWGDE
jgi:hypothetical protein